MLDGPDLLLLEQAGHAGRADDSSRASCSRQSPVLVACRQGGNRPTPAPRNGQAGQAEQRSDDPGR